MDAATETKRRKRTIVEQLAARIKTIDEQLVTLRAKIAKLEAEREQLRPSNVGAKP